MLHVEAIENDIFKEKIVEAYSLNRSKSKTNLHPFLLQITL